MRYRLYTILLLVTLSCHRSSEQGLMLYPTETQIEWNELGIQFANEVNEMMDYVDKHGWEGWQGPVPVDPRANLADTLLYLLKSANKLGKVEEFRRLFPPAHAPFIKYYREKGQSIEQLHFIDNEKIVFLTGSAYEKRQAYLLDGDKISQLAENIHAIGKSMQQEIFAIAANNRITVRKRWEGEIIKTFELQETKDLEITRLLPFNDGEQVLLVSSEGMYLISSEKEWMIHPVPNLEDEEWTSSMDMENATLSNDNKYIVVGDQDSDHRILSRQGKEIGTIGPQSSYPHYCLFSKDDQQLITNSCHFYDGLTIGIKTDIVEGLAIEPYQESEKYTLLDSTMRVYTGIAIEEGYILGDAYGNIRKIDKTGKIQWRHHLGSSISGITISEDKNTIWVGSYSGMLHKLKLGRGHRDQHTIGNGDHYEAFRMIIWKDEPSILKW